MNLNARDLGIIFAMSIAVIAMSFTFPALGLTGSEQDENDIPEFDIGKNVFDFAGAFPTEPNVKTSGTLVWDGIDTTYKESHHNLSANPDYTISVQVRPGPGDPILVDLINSTTSPSTPIIVTGDLNQVGASESLGLGDGKWITDFILRVYEPQNDYYEVEYKVYSGDQSDSSGVIGGIVDAVVLLMEVFLWFFKVLFEFILNIFVITVEVTAYIVNLLSWLTSTYANIVSGAPGWASVIVAIPGILLSLQFLKLVIIAVEVIWIG